MNLNPEILDEEGKSILFARVASKLLEEGKVDQATLISEVGIKKHPNYAQGHYILAKCYQDKDMYEEARVEYERVLKYDSSHFGAIKELAGLYQSTGLNDVYKDYLFRLLTLDPLNDRVLDECKEQGVYDLWKSKSDSVLTFQNNLKAEPDSETDLSMKDQDESPKQPSETEKKESEDLLKIDLTKFENQVDDFTTIMDGLIQETEDEGKEADTQDYLKDLESPMEPEEELLAEEKPIEESIDELDAFEKEEIMEDSKSPFMELDFAENIDQNQDVPEEKVEHDPKIEEEKEIRSIEEEIDNEPEAVEKSFEEPILKLDDENSEEKPETNNNVHDKTELIFNDSNKNVELEFEIDKEESVSEVNEDQTGPEVKEEEPISKPDKEESSTTNEDIKLDDTFAKEPETQKDEGVGATEEKENPYVKQKIVSQTLGEILVSQNKYKEAKEVFLALKQQQPDNANIDKKLEILDKIIALEENKEN